jgi:hypothetical protein
MRYPIQWLPLYGLAAAGLIGSYIMATGGIKATSPEQVMILTGASQTVANRKAKIFVSDVTHDAQLVVLCGDKRHAVNVPLKGKPSKEVCGIQIRYLGRSEGTGGLPKVTLEVSW